MSSDSKEIVTDLIAQMNSTSERFSDEGVKTIKSVFPRLQRIIKELHQEDISKWDSLLRGIDHIKSNYMLAIEKKNNKIIKSEYALRREQILDDLEEIQRRVI